MKKRRIRLLRHTETSSEMIMSAYVLARLAERDGRMTIARIENELTGSEGVVQTAVIQLQKKGIISFTKDGIGTIRLTARH